MALDLETLLEGSPVYGVVDTRDGAVLFRRPGHETAFDAMVIEAVGASGETFEAIPLTRDARGCDRLFIAPLGEHPSFRPRWPSPGSVKAGAAAPHTAG